MTNVNHDYDPARPEIRIDVDREQAKRLGFSTLDVASAVRGAIYGNEVGKIPRGQGRIQNHGAACPDVRENLNGLNEIVISKDDKEAPLTERGDHQPGRQYRIHQACRRQADHPGHGGTRAGPERRTRAQGAGHGRGQKIQAAARAIPSAREAGTACRRNRRDFSSRRFLSPWAWCFSPWCSSSIRCSSRF